MSKITLLSSILAISILFSGCSKDKTSTIEDANSILATKTVKKEQNRFELTSIENKTYTIKKESNGFFLENDKSKIIILDIFATWCPPCRAEASHLASLQKKFKDDLVVIGVTIEDGIQNDKLENFKHEFGADYVLVNSAQNRPLVNAVAKSLNVGSNFGIPLMAMYKDGKLVRYYQGATEEEFIESDIKMALGKK